MNSNVRKFLNTVLSVFLAFGLLFAVTAPVKAEEVSDDPMDLRPQYSQPIGGDTGKARVLDDTPNFPFPSSERFTDNARFDGVTKHYGIDVSDHNGTIDWQKVRAGGVEFAFIRVAYRGYGTLPGYGKMSEDATFRRNIQAAKAAGIKVGVYVFSQAITVAEAKEEAQYALNLLSGTSLDLPVMIDREFGEDDDTFLPIGRLYDAELSIAEETDIISAFCDRVLAYGYDAGIYASTAWYVQRVYEDLLPDDYVRWVADYYNYCHYSGPYNFWQYSSQGKINGISTLVDMNVWYESTGSVKPSYGHWSGSRYINSDGTYPVSQFMTIDGNTYYFNNSGYYVTGWQLIKGDYYHFGYNGVMDTGWYQSSNGLHYLGQDGKERYGLQKINGTGYYFDEDGVMQTGWIEVNGKWYHFASNGKMDTGWYDSSNGRHYLGTDGAECYGWQKIDGKYYYFDDNGVMQKGWYKTSGGWHYFGTDGAERYGWQKVDGSWYYMDSDGVMQTGWIKESGTWYYLDRSGAMQTGWIKDGSTWYYLRSSGAMATGWVKDGGTWYYLKSSGAMATGWLQIDGDWYYFYSSGAMAYSTWIGSYYVNSSGVWVY